MSASRAAVVLFAAAAAAAAAALASAAAAAETVLLAGRVLDVRTGRVATDQVITVVDGVIANITGITQGGAAALSRAGRDVVDLSDAFVLPGLIDAHVHLFLRPYNIVDWNTQVTQESIPQRTLRAGMYARRTILSGFTTVRDLGTEGAEDADQDLKRAIAEGWVDGPRLYIASRAIVSTGSYPPKGYNYYQYVGAEVADGVDEMRKVVRRQLNYGGADWIKLYGDYSRYQGKYYPNFSVEEMAAAVSEAAEVGAKVAVHAVKPDAILRAVQAGVRSIEHGDQANDEALTAMRDKNVALCPTLAIFEAAASWDPEDIPRFETAKAVVRRALELGVEVVAGSDVGGVENGENVREIELYVDVGMTPLQAIQSATIKAAALVDPAAGLGVLEAGAPADLIAVAGDPLARVADLRQVKFVMKGGRIYRDDDSASNATPRRTCPH